MRPLRSIGRAIFIVSDPSKHERHVHFECHEYFYKYSWHSIYVFKITSIFVVLSQTANNAQVRTVLPLLGAAMFSSVLAFFLLQIVNRIK